MTLPLNEAQRRAVSHPGGPLLVVAGAGTGKTRMLTARIASLIESGAALPRQVFAVTFTNKAASEMRQRVASLLGAEPRGLWIGTFHALAARLLRIEAPRLGFAPGFTIYDEDDQLALVRRLLERLDYSPKAYPPRAVRSIISHAKNKMVRPEALEREAFDPLTSAAAQVYHVLGDALRAANAMDFDDLLLHPLTLFREHPDRLAAWQHRFRHVLVDEFQDTNRAQYDLVRFLAMGHQNLCVVGDDDQAIYGWRGADVRHMLDFGRDFPEATVIRLEENYRSTERILEAANTVIAGNLGRLGKTLRATRSEGTAVTVYAAGDDRDEADWIVRETAEHRARGVPYDAIAILYRTNAQSRALEEAFRRVGTPYRIVGTVGFYERREVKDLLAYLRLVANPHDDAAFLRAVRVPRRGIGQGTIDQLMGHARAAKVPLATVAADPETVPGIRPQAAAALRRFGQLIEALRVEAVRLPPATLLERVVTEIDYDRYLTELEGDTIDRWENVRELIASAAEWSELADAADDEGGTPLVQFLAQAALLTSTDRIAGDAEGVTLTTLHNAKGLEWDVVVVSGAEDGLLPLARNAETPEGEEEERRLCYVGLTRARERLYVTWAAVRRRGGEFRPAFPSRFLAALGSDVESRTGRGSWRAWHRPARAAASGEAPSWDDEHELSQDAPRYQHGERVRHHRFGGGTIVRINRGGPDLKVVVTFDDADIGTKELVVRYAGLEREWVGE